MHSMVDGVFDVLAAVMVMGIVFSIAFGFILPLTKTEYMQYDTQYEDKAILGDITDYSDPANFKDRRMYSYEEIVLLMAVQNNKMPNPKGISVRHLITEEGFLNLDNTSYDNADINYKPSSFTEPALRYDGVLAAAQLYGENHYIYIPGEGYFPPNDKKLKNIGIIRMTEDYEINVDEMCLVLTKSNLSIKTVKNGQKLINSAKKYYITYQYSIPKNLASTKLIYHEPIYVIQRKDASKDTLQTSETFLAGIRASAKAS